MSSGSEGGSEDLIVDLGRMRDELSRPPLGSKENPVVLVVSKQAADAAIEQGTTLQEVADQQLNMHTKVVVADE